MKPTSLAEQIPIDVPLNRAPFFLERFFTERRTPEGNETTLHLTVPGLPRGVTLEHDVLATFVREGRWKSWNDAAELSWHADGGGPFPTFHGELKILADEDYNSAILAIKGSYTPPGGAAGRVFDATLGRKIAHGTAQQLLRELKSAVEEYHVDEERTRASAPSSKLEDSDARPPGEVH
jgi:hypothetical protein